MQRVSLPFRILLLPIDLIRMLVLAVRISVWHVAALLRSSTLKLPPSHAFCHPLRMKVGDVKINTCPFALKFANPRLFSWLCGYCHMRDRGARKGIPLCRRRGGGPASSVTQVLCGILPVLVGLATAFYVLRPNPGMLGEARRYLANPLPDPAPEPAATRTVAAQEAPATEEGTAGEELPPMLRPPRTGEVVPDLPPPPMGFSPLERRLAGVKRPAEESVLPENSEQEVPDLPPPPMGFSPLERRLAGTKLWSEEDAHVENSELAELAKIRRAVADGEFDKALALAEHAAANLGGGTEARLLIAGIKLQAGKLEEARDLAAKILEVSPESAEAHAILGRVHLEQGDISQAKSSYEQALRLDPECDSARIGMARIAILNLRRE